MAVQGASQSEGSASLFVLGSFVVACSAKVARLPHAGESLLAEAFTLEPGGKGLNLALGAHRLGMAVDGLLAVGDDIFADFAELALVRAGLPPGMLRRYRTTTGSGIGFADAAGENCLAVYPGANLHLSAEDVAAAAPALRRSAMVLAQFEIPDAPIAAAFSLARQAGIPTLLNPSPFRPVAPGILADTSVLVLNRVEAAALGEGADMEGMARRLLAAGPEVVVVTLGAEGAVAFRADAPPLFRPALRVRSVDALGAGDAFAACLAASLAQGKTLAASLERAAASGAYAVTRLGAYDGLPTLAELERFLYHHASTTSP